MPAHLDAVIFDFDGVIADSEPLHYRAFADTLAAAGFTLTREAYYARYLGYDDVGAFDAVAKDQGRPLDAAAIRGLVEAKERRMHELTAGSDVLFPGAADFIRACAAEVPVAVCSGALRQEIAAVLDAAGLASAVRLVVAAGDTPQSKPSPEPYRLAFARLNAAAGGGLRADRTVAIEDSRWGLESARGAGLRLVGVTNSYGAEALPGAELVVAGLHALSVEMLDEVCGAARAR
ncbi:MAG: HAD family hydrolase [Vicinamibacterales bacterium]